MGRRRFLTAMILTAIACAAIAVIPRPTAGQLSADQRQLLDAAHDASSRGWLLTSDTAGGYGTFASSIPSSVYHTSWTIALLGRFGTRPATIDPRSLGDVMRLAIADPGRLELPPIEGLWLATRTLRDLGQPIPIDAIGAQLPAYLTPAGLYALDPGGKPDWGATAIAAHLATAVGQSLPTSTLRRISEAIADSRPPVTIESLVNERLPVWEGADLVLPAAERSLQAATIPVLAAYLADWISAHPDAAGGELLGAISSLEDIVKANGDQTASLDARSLWESLKTPNGGFAASRDVPIPDPHTTFDALTLGAPVSEGGLSYFASRARADGWSADQTIDPCSTYMGLSISEAAGDHRHAGPVAATAATWLERLAAQPDLSEPTLCAVATAKGLGLTIPVTTTNALRRAALLTVVSTAAIDQRSRSLKALELLGLGADQLPHALTSVAASSDSDPEQVGIEAFAMCQSVARLTGTQVTCRFPADLQLGDGTFKQSAGAPIADLRSTAIGWLASTDIAARVHILERFRSKADTWMLPSGAASNVTSLRSLFIGLVLAGVLPASSLF